MRFYLDTSVFGGYFDKEFEKSTHKLFDLIENQDIKVTYSNILEKELESAPEKVKLISASSFIKGERIEVTKEMLDLADVYIKEGALTEKSINDARHIAIATIGGVNAVITWNFKHMANFMRIEQYNSINLQQGYTRINIYSPMQIAELEY